MSRQPLPSGFTGFYVDTVNGNDSNDGLTTSTAKQTLNASLSNILQNYDCGGTPPTINVLPGSTITEQLYVAGTLTGAPMLNITGCTTVGSYTPWVLQGNNQTAIHTRDNGILQIKGFAFSSGGHTGCNFLMSSQNGVLDYDHIDFGAAPGGNHIYVVNGGACNCTDTGSSIYISGSANAHIMTQGPGAYHFMSGATITVSTGLSFAAFVQTYLLSWTGWGFNYFKDPSGNPASITGMKYYVNENAVFSPGGSTVPGTAAGQTTSGGLIG